jgi:membrane associated rhomboid family serine protease
MILPYNVDRPARLTPTVTYALMAVNILVYVLGIGYTNYKMYADRPSAPAEESTLQDGGAGGTGAPEGSEGGAPGASEDGAANSTQAMRFLGPATFGPAFPSLPSRTFQGGPDIAPAPNAAPGSEGSEGGGSEGGGEEGGLSGADGGPETMAEMREMIDEIKAQSKTPEGREKLWEWRRAMWNAEHRTDALALDTHPDILRLFAYLTVAPSFLTIFTSMFLHGDLLHLMGNMLFLWVFGRAVEDTLGRGIYLGAYFSCGFAATLLYHIMDQQFSPGMMIPAMGASGAIMGVLGLFAPRFYRTPVRLFYTNGIGARIFYLGTAMLGGVFAKAFNMGASGTTLAALLMLAGIVIVGDETLWGEWKCAAAWIIGAKMAVQDLIPGIIGIVAGGAGGGGVAHWAHIGGFLCGALYGLLIGAHKEGKAEYLVDEARTSLDNKYAANAIESAQQVVMMKPDDPVGYQLLAEAYDRKDDREKALENYKIAVDKYLRRNERSAASKLYQEAMKRHTEWVPPANVLFLLAGQMAKDEDWRASAETLAKIPYIYPEASEGEMAFVRSAQIYIERLDEPVVAMQLLYEFGNRFPQSQWMSQAMKLYEAANQKHTGAPAKV